MSPLFYQNIFHFFLSFSISLIPLFDDPKTEKERERMNATRSNGWLCYIEQKKKNPPNADTWTENVLTSAHRKPLKSKGQYDRSRCSRILTNRYWSHQIWIASFHFVTPFVCVCCSSPLLWYGIISLIPKNLLPFLFTLLLILTIAKHKKISFSKSVNLVVMVQQLNFYHFLCFI